MEEKEKVIKEINKLMLNIFELLDEKQLEYLKIELKKIYFTLKMVKDSNESEE